jgi:hypothetical protein
MDRLVPALNRMPGPASSLTRPSCSALVRSAATLLVTACDGSSLPTATHPVFRRRRPDNKVVGDALLRGAGGLAALAALPFSPPAAPAPAVLRPSAARAAATR